MPQLAYRIPKKKLLQFLDVIWFHKKIVSNAHILAEIKIFEARKIKLVLFCLPKTAHKATLI